MAWWWTENRPLPQIMLIMVFDAMWPLMHWCCQSNRMGDGQHLNLKMDMDGWRNKGPIDWTQDKSVADYKLECCILIFLAATKQLYKWYFPSVRPSVRLSVTPFWLCSHHLIIMKFSGVITNDQSKVHAKGQGQRSKVKVTEVTTQLNRCI